MIDFWLAAGLLLLVALAFLLIPVLRGRKAQAEEDRTALNVALYQERLAELQGQRTAGTLTEEQLEAGRAEAARELLADTEGADTGRSSRLGKALPLAVALAVPLLGIGLYLHWGASDKVELAREMREQPRTIEEMTARLEKVVQAQPDSAEGWYFLGRTYMAQERAGDAAKAYERAVQVAGRQPELLGQWAQALYFASQKRFTPEVQALTEEALKADANEVTSLGLLGIAGFEEGRFKDAIGYWERLIAVLPQDDPSRGALQGGIERAREKLAESGETLPERDTLTKSMPQLKVRVDLASALKDKVQPGDAVFIFARAAEGPPMPLAVKRLTVKDLPAEVVLSDADAMMPQLKISNFAQVQLVARISREGNAKAGEWIGRSPALSSAVQEQQRLTIDSPDQP
ncbi:c-type cytochrome biogenesis protein CcmI [Pseudomonas sp. No.21]|uniref:c-type cytochrome biogenesis protein CcmI n=1 Tax=Pseudomonas TaxID=286 RepID=UPI000DA982DC|nr:MULTISPECIES: c-type cytochrome biogenesis protein CcmI [Pseudomonas]MDW3711960.1 c-type cytochrome biogenesis protein CcmI [Pseudomonas sp. 2023EL-01195]PZE13605.1 c-type cytochrome biogenesis protein CcmI [Pseudomonas sp. 57B-090624]GJN48432.1 cytochrome c-type biogenesis protein CycH [Pseudomonas tohonis]